MQPTNYLPFIHKALYALLFHATGRLQQMDITIDDEAEELFEVVQEVLLLLEVYHTRESSIDDLLWDYEPSLVISLLSKRKSCQQYLHDLNNSINALKPDQTDVSKIEWFQATLMNFRKMVGEEIVYLSQAEEVFNSILYRYYKPDHLHHLQSQIIQSTGPWILDLYEKWIVRSISNTEAKAWLKRLRADPSKIPYQSLLKKLQQELPEKRNVAILRSLQEQATLLKN